MIAYHGSPETGLKKLTYSEENSRFGGDYGLKHGAAIYLTVSEEEAKAYSFGGSVYKVKISKPVFDATDEEVLIQFIKNFESKISLADNILLNDENILDVVSMTLKGKSSGVDFVDNLFSVISNKESLYFSVISEMFNSDSDLCLDSLKKDFIYSFVKLNNTSGTTWILCLDFSGDGVEILEENSAV